MNNCSECIYNDVGEKLDEVTLRVHQIHCDLKSGIPKIRAQYNLDSVISELNAMLGEKE